jgi:hypothetical protein
MQIPGMRTMSKLPVLPAKLENVENIGHIVKQLLPFKGNGLNMLKIKIAK